MMEDPVEGGRVGPTLVCLLTEQFARLRTGDRFWYENEAVFTVAQRDQLKQANLGRVLCDNGDDIRKAPKDAFLTTSKLEELEDCSALPRISLRPWADCSLEEEVEVRREMHNKVEIQILKYTGEEEEEEGHNIHQQSKEGRSRRFPEKDQGG